MAMDMGMGMGMDMGTDMDLSMDIKTKKTMKALVQIQITQMMSIIKKMKTIITQ